MAPRRTTSLARITYRLHQQRETHLQPSIELRKRYLEKAYAAQLRSEKEMIQGHIHKMQPGVGKVFLMQRLAQLSKN